MSQPPLEALPDDIARLLERERDAYPIDPERQRAVRSRVEMAIALGGGALGGGGLGGGGGAGPSSMSGSPGTGATAAGVAARGVAGKMIAVGLAAFVGGGVTGGAIVRSTTHAPAVVPMVAAPPSISAPVAPLPAPAPVPAPLASVPTTTDVPSAPVRASAAPSSTVAPTGQGDLARERELLDVARAALARNQAQDAIATLEEHARRWPNGKLAEEREVVLVQALVTAGRLPEARARAARFHQRFPKSFFAGAVDAAVGAGTSGH
jgi:hypothetical protein